MATVTEVMLTCDVCGSAKDVQTWTFRLDGKAYETDLCPKDGKDLSKVAAGYIEKARKVTGKRSQRRAVKASGDKAKASGTKQGARASGDKAKASGTKQGARASGAKASQGQPPEAVAAPKQTAQATGVRQEKGIYVYGILPADIEVAADTPGVGEHPGLLRVVRSGDLAALISEVDLSDQMESPDDLKIHREILDATAAEVPVLPLRSRTVLPSEDAVAQELLAAHHDEFAAALEELDGRAEFLIRGRYAEKAATARRDEDTRALGQAMESVCVDSVVLEPVNELDALHVAFLVAVDEQSEVEQVIEDLAWEWEGRIEVQLLGPMAAYDFVETAQPKG